MIAEKILDEHSVFLGPNKFAQTLAAMQSYADFFYWLGKEGWVPMLESSQYVNSKTGLYNVESDLYQDYLKTKQ